VFAFSTKLKLFKRHLSIITFLYSFVNHSRAYCHDPEVYPNPLKFSPERYLTNDDHEPEPDPRDVSFGFGRRVCPGRFIADTAIFVTMAQTLAAYHISKPLGHDGREIEPTIDFTPGFVTSPVPFQCAFTLRSPKYEDLIRAVEKQHPFGVGDADILEAASAAEREGTRI
jgi:Cytochrome P450